MTNWERVAAIFRFGFTLGERGMAGKHLLPDWRETDDRGSDSRAVHGETAGGRVCAAASAKNVKEVLWEEAMNMSDKQLYLAGIFNAHFGCGGIIRAERIAGLTDRNYERLQDAFEDLWPIAQEHAQLFFPGCVLPKPVNFEKIFRVILREDWRDWRKFLASLSEPEWSELQRALHLFRQSSRRAAA